MKRIIFIGILVSVFAFSGLASAGMPAIGCFPEILLDSLLVPNPAGECEHLTGSVPDKKLLPNHWILEADLCDGVGFDSLPVYWVTSDHDNGGQGGFQPTYEDTFGCGCAAIIEIMELNVYYPGALDGHTKFGCTRSLIEDFMVWCSSNPFLCTLDQ